MVRTQVYLSKEQHSALRQAAEREGVTMSGLLRRMVEFELLVTFKRQDHAKAAVMALADLGRSGRSDISENHDEALAGALRNDV